MIAECTKQVHTLHIIATETATLLESKNCAGNGIATGNRISKLHNSLRHKAGLHSRYAGIGGFKTIFKGQVDVPSNGASNSNKNKDSQRITFLNKKTRAWANPSKFDLFRFNRTKVVCTMYIQDTAFVYMILEDR